MNWLPLGRSNRPRSLRVLHECTYSMSRIECNEYWFSCQNCGQQLRVELHTYHHQNVSAHAKSAVLLRSAAKSENTRSLKFSNHYCYSCYFSRSERTCHVCAFITKYPATIHMLRRTFIMAFVIACRRFWYSFIAVYAKHALTCWFARIRIYRVRLLLFRFNSRRSFAYRVFHRYRLTFRETIIHSNYFIGIHWYANGGVLSMRKFMNYTRILRRIEIMKSSSS